ncbi:MAG TPA: CvpA family protein [Terriglobia bacterium]|nr:CvpA family protein [Terriglobia bacterium]
MSFISELNVLDWIVVVIVASSVISSVLKGFAREAISLAAVILGLLLASWFYPQAGSLVSAYVKTQEIASLVGFILIFLGVLLAGAIISFVVTKFLRVVDLQWFDRLLGAAFGLARGWLVGSVIFLGLTAFPVQIEVVQHATLGPHLLMSARVLAVITPAPLKEQFLEGYDKVRSLWEKAAKSSAS